MSRPPSDPSRRLSNNPFRQDLTGPAPAFSLNRSTSSVHLSGSAFEEWVSKNKQLLELSDEDEDVPQRPAFPAQSRTGSDSNVNYRYVYLLALPKEHLAPWTARPLVRG